jgi:hypothetical protein
MKVPIILSFCFAFLLQTLGAQSSVWKVSNGDQVVYIGGTSNETHTKKSLRLP